VRFSIVLASRFVFAASIAFGCGGQSIDPGTTTSGGGGSGGGGGSPGTGGTGMPAPVDMCVVTSMKVCQNAGCHGGMPIAANLRLENDVLLHDYMKLVDAPNHGDQPAGCMPGMFKLIDASSPTDSLIYTKLSDLGSNPPCASRMPIIGSFAPADKMCVLSWINSVIAATKGP
jgi:hypothetical protein